MPKSLVIIPAYNERENIANLVQALLQHPDLDVLVVDDGHDGTDQIVAQIAQQESRVRLLKRHGKGGRGSAVLEGMRLGMKSGYLFFIEMDADFSHAPNVVPALLALADSQTIAIGSRYVHGSRIVNWSLGRRIFSWLANFYARLVLGIPIHDYTNGYRVYPRAAVAHLLSVPMIAKGYIVLSEMAFILYRKGFGFREIPTTFVNRERGGSNFSVQEVYEAFTAIARIRWRSSVRPSTPPNLFRLGTAVFVATLAIHALIFFAAFPKSYFENRGSDYTEYQLLADNLLSGHGLSVRTEPPYVPDTIRTPMYPIFLALVKRAIGSFYPSLYLTLLLGATIPLAGFFLMRLLTEDTRFWWLTAAILALDPNLFYYSFIYGSEGLAAPLFAWAVVLCAYALHQRRYALAAGIVTGFATLTRPVVQLLPLLFAFAALVKTPRTIEMKRYARSALFVCFVGFAAVVAPWVLRNYIVFSVLNYSSVGWFNMYTRTAVTAEAIHEGKDYPSMRLEFLDRLWQKGYVQKRPVIEREVSGFEFEPIFRKEAFATIKRYPKEFVISQMSAFFTIVGQDITVLILNASGYTHAPYPSFSPVVKLTREGIGPTIVAVRGFVFSPWIISIVGRVYFLCLFALSLLAPILAWRRERRVWPVVLFLCLYQLMVIGLSLNIAAQASGRYRTQFIFSEVPLALYALITILKMRTYRRKVMVADDLLTKQDNPL